MSEEPDLERARAMADELVTVGAAERLSILPRDRLDLARAAR